MTTTKRFGEIDLLRSLAIVLMIVYHTAFDLAVLYGWNIDVLHGWWWLLARSTACLFLLLVGISFALSRQRMAHKNLRRFDQWKRHLRRALIVGGAAGLVSLGTYIANPHTFVRFGILHLIAVSALLLPLVAPLKLRTLPLGFLLLLLHPFAQEILSTHAWFLSIGIRPYGFASVDYFPLIPWFGVILIGYGAGQLFFTNHKPRTTNRNLSLFMWLGRHSLFLYLIHQPIIIGVLWMILGKPTL